MLTNRTRIAICVPLRNEAIALPGLLGALASLDIDGVEPTLCLLLDGCTDRSEALSAEIAPTMPFAVALRVAPRSTRASAGRARRAAMAMGAEAIGSSGDAALLTTDADSQPRADWVQASLHALSMADVAAGRIVRVDGDRDRLQCRVEAYFDRLHAYRRMVDPVPWDPAPGHHFGGGANLAMRADAYRAIGGFRDVGWGEDALFLDDASRAGFRVRRDPAMVVATSSRRIGRAEGGLAATLAGLAERGAPEVMSPAASVWQYARHAAARDTFANLDNAATREAFGRMIGLSGDHVLGVGRDCPNAEAFAIRIVPSAPDHQHLIPLARAEALLADLERTWCRGAA